MLSILLAVFALAVFASEDALKDVSIHWENFKVAHNKTYGNDEEHDRRFQIFQRNHKFIVNFPKDRGFEVGHNEFSDLTNEEFRARFNGLRINKVPGEFSPRLSLKFKVPQEWDWRSKGAVTAIKNQGHCGSCWSFSATGSMEGAWFLKKGQLVSLSEQNLVDCSTAYGNEGCQGGLMDDAFQYVIANKGIDTEASYPYTATGPNACRYNAANRGTTISNYHDIQSGSESALLQAVALTPVSVAIDAGHDSFQFYRSGVYNEPDCSSSVLDHGVLAIGWGMYQGTTAYWLVKNSWGTSWGLQGYIMMSRNAHNQCGIATAASYPVV